MKRSRRLRVLIVLPLFFLAACQKMAELPSEPDDLEPPPVTGEDPVLPAASDPAAEISPPDIAEPPSPPPEYPSVALAADWADNGLSTGRVNYQNTFKRGGAAVLTADGSFPQVGVAAIDTYYLNCRDDFERLCESGAEEAGDGTPYQFDAGFTIEINAGGLLSVSRTVFQYRGGAHGGADIRCETFSAVSGKLLTLDDFFPAGRDEYTGRMLEYIDAAIDAAPGEFWPDAKQIARDLFPYDLFCVTKDGISLFFPEYNLSSYAAGTVRVDVPWGAVADIFVLPG